MMKLWESEHFSLNLLTGEIEKIKSEYCFEGVNFEQGQLALVKSKLPHLRLTGGWYEKGGETIEKLINVYEELVDPVELVKYLTDDEFLDWLDEGTEEDVRATLSKFQESKMGKYLGFIIGHLKHKYGSKN